MSKPRLCDTTITIAIAVLTVAAIIEFIDKTASSCLHVENSNSTAVPNDKTNETARAVLASAVPSPSDRENGTKGGTRPPFFDYKMDDSERTRLKKKTAEMINREVRRKIPRNIQMLVDPCTCISVNKIVMINKTDLAKCMIDRLDTMGSDYLFVNSSYRYGFGSSQYFFARSTLYVCNRIPECMDLETRRIMASSEAIGEYVDEAWDATVRSSCSLELFRDGAFAIRSYIATHANNFKFSKPLTRLTKLVIEKAKECCHRKSESVCVNPVFLNMCIQNYLPIGYVAENLCKQYKLNEFM
nr:MAG: hypothetical protein [Metapenaeus ensis nimavirus]